MVKVSLLGVFILAGVSVVSVADGAVVVATPASGGELMVGSASCLVHTGLAQVQNACSSAIEVCVPQIISTPGNYDVFSQGFIPANSYMECSTTLVDSTGRLVGATGWSSGNVLSGGPAIFENGVLPLPVGGPGNPWTPFTCCILGPQARFASANYSGPIQSATFTALSAVSTAL
jgi:hypothetical protein